jgi:NAD(P)-dependent dehydrogenase (short-subunit alcohol dehydrogenase family)
MVTASTPDRDRSILISGAASGIGRATALLFARKGWRVGAIDVDAVALSSLENKLPQQRAWLRVLDISDRAALQAAVDDFAVGGTLDLLFNNAGIDAKGSFEAMPWERITRTVEVNLLAGLALIQAGIPLLKKTPGSLCLSTSSASAIFGTAGMAVYSATKHALKGLTEALAVELAPHGVRAADILPGIVDTGMLGSEQKACMPAEGLLRVLPAEAIADTVWAAFHGDKLHWYVPEELAAYDVDVTRHPEAARDRRIAGGY